MTEAITHSDSNDTGVNAVEDRYSAAAQAVEPSLCCPVQYDANYLKMIPEEIIERDYGCGDPSAFVREGDTVLDLGSGGGKICYIASQIVGASGRVIGVDCNLEMLGLARQYQQEMAERLGYANVEFKYGRIQDLALDHDQLNRELADSDLSSPNASLNVLQRMETMRRQTPMIEDNSVDCVVSNCVLNLVDSKDRTQLFSEILRVLKPGGKAAISDIVADEDVPERLQQDGHLWSGCISGAWREDLFLKAFEQAGFHGIGIAKFESEPWQVVDGIQFRSVTVTAYKGKEGPCLERNQAVIYNGPFKSVEDDDGHRYQRGTRTAVCDKTFHLLQKEPYLNAFTPIEPLESIPLEDAQSYDCLRTVRRHPRETKGLDYEVTTEQRGASCEPGCC